MDLTIFKIITGIILFLVSLVGGFLPMKISQISDSLMKLCNAFAGGILIAAALCHMLAESSGDLEDEGKAFNKAIGGDPEEPFPLGFALCVLGFFLVVLIEVVLDPHADGEGHGHGGGGGGAAGEGLGVEGHGHEASLTGRSMVSNVSIVKNASVAGFATLIALLIHSCIEGLAAGATSDPEQAFAIVLAIMCHKGFAAFALGSTMLPLRAQGQSFAWAVSVIAFAATTPLAMAVGTAAQHGLEGGAVAAVTCVAAGSLLAIGINEMLVPSLADAKHPIANCLVSIVASVLMSLLAAWV